LAEAVRLLARFLAPRVRINGIAAGATLPGAEDKADTFGKLATLAPLERTGTPEDVLAALEFLLRAQGTTGHILDLANGMGLPPLLAGD
jgi:NAD(P)-dependent dehydrogenase (short-subunit alcohol dehydrogenase family)